jgi:hypothetical protein
VCARQGEKQIFATSCRIGKPDLKRFIAVGYIGYIDVFRRRHGRSPYARTGAFVQLGGTADGLVRSPLLFRSGNL